MKAMTYVLESPLFKKLFHGCRRASAIQITYILTNDNDHCKTVFLLSIKFLLLFIHPGIEQNLAAPVEDFALHYLINGCFAEKCAWKHY